MIYDFLNIINDGTVISSNSFLTLISKTVITDRIKIPNRKSHFVHRTYLCSSGICFTKKPT